MAKHFANVGLDEAEFLATVDLESGPLFADLGGGRVEILDLDRAIGLGENVDGVVSRDDGDLVLSIEGIGYVIHVAQS